jgi:hypothetical protein
MPIPVSGTIRIGQGALRSTYWLTLPQQRGCAAASGQDEELRVG